MSGGFSISFFFKEASILTILTLFSFRLRGTERNYREWCVGNILSSVIDRIHVGPPDPSVHCSGEGTKCGRRWCTENNGQRSSTFGNLKHELPPF